MVALLLRLLAVFAAGANPRDISYWTVIGRIDQFCLGIIAARLYVRKHVAGLNVTWFLLSAVAVVGILVVFNRLGGWPSTTRWKMAWPTIEGVMWAGFIVTYLAAGQRLPALLSRVGGKLGEISYSTYLVHYAVIVAIIKHAWYVRATGNGYYDALITTFLVALPMTVAIATVTYYTVELPFLQLRPRYVMRSADPISPL
jgi:peptidoglycan/LPS O-acetylase OafA/YrhL